ncbi:MAG: type II secretion system protein [Bacilli bacterium]|nr:type II secretion system protein [Bacilli bacterium]
MNKKGFTLIELLSILAILSIIVAVAMPSLVESNRIAKINETKDFEDMVKTACNTYKAVNPSATSVKVNELAQQGYLKSTTTDPAGHKVGTIETVIMIEDDGCKYTYGG